MDQQDPNYWQQDHDKVNRLLNDGPEAYFATVPMAAAFISQPKELRCIDERVDGNIALGGSGILLGLDTSAELLKDAGLDSITSHQGCGAAALYCQQQGIAADQVDQTAINFAKQLAEKLGVPYTKHQPVNPSFHIARAIYYVGAETFNPRALPQLPAGFVVSRFYHHDRQTALDEVGLSIDIAFGDHGFGDLFTPRNPLLLLAIAHPNSPTLNQTTLLDELGQLNHPQSARVKTLAWTPLAS